MKTYDEEDYLMLSGIQHFEFCRRQWALIHIEQQWEENLRTVEGNIMHEKAHDGLFTEKRKNIIVTRGMRVFSKTLGISGICDVVEFHRDDLIGVEIFGREGKYCIYPIEYKRGEPKENDADILQLTAQAM
ncbi:MAG: Dna2/Cas4 domain-containing protein, partial [Eubacterium sp.]